MKIVSTSISASLLFGVASAILGGDIVPSGTKTYVVGLRNSSSDSSFCAGALISPTHVLTSPLCNKEGINYVSVGAHKVNGTDNGEVIKVKTVDIHPSYNPNDPWAWDFAIVTLENPSKFAPVKLASHDSDIQEGTLITMMGWGAPTWQGGDYSLELRNVTLEAWDTKNCIDVFTETFYPSQLCAGGVLNKGTVDGDWGGPLIKGNKEGDADDVLLGTNTEGYGYGSDYPNVFSRVTTALSWIDSIVNSH
ncbi:Glucanase inhibitor protein 2 trypsin-like protein [Phytophthora palmivora]|uniref:Glucanase inhibitor protein 2 trypsin-like protein n=1 Tax=Phytophthora palmivora TaxID=4796 RepID=A0A2P4XJU7_9STRA|nr:Glucanase inhibitor protein 2 trypsin-like protein [Phytophthora palmivora]